MSEKLVGIVWQFAIAVLDRWLDAQIEQLKSPEVKATARRIEDEVVRILSGPVGLAVGQAVARTITVRALERWFENRTDTKYWG